MRKRLCTWLTVSLLLCALEIPFLPAQQRVSPDHSSKVKSEIGRATYNSSCAGCHGLDGHGSDKAVNISDSARVRHLSGIQLSGIISNGIPGTGMPAFRNLNDKQIRAVIVYLRSLQGKVGSRALPGDATRGKGIFFSKGECSTCHTISGEGGFLGPDLSGYGSSASVNAIRDEIVRSSRMPAEGYRPAVLTTQQGHRIEGLIRNEDNFSLQLQTKDGEFRFFEKSELRDVDRLKSSLMPTDFGNRLSPVEVDDLVSYLMIVAPEAGTLVKRHKNEEDFD